MAPLELLRSNPSLRKIVSFDLLARAATARCGDPALRQYLIAEVLVRCWLAAGGGSFGKHRWAPILKACLLRIDTPASIPAALFDWLGKQSTTRNFVLPGKAICTQLKKACALAQQDLNVWKNANGVIAFVPATGRRTGDVILLPYSLLPSGDGHGYIITCKDHEPLIGLEHGARRAVDIAIHAGWFPRNRAPVFMLGTIDSDVAGELTGESAGLPILASIYCLHQRNTPGPFDYGLSGVLAPALPGYVSAEHDDHSIGRKLACFRECGFRTIILPECESRAHGVKWCSPGNELTSWLPMSLNIVGANRQGLKRHEIESTLESCELGMRYGNTEPAKAILDLTALADELANRGDVASQQYLAKARLLMATAECHRGNTSKSLALARQVSRTSTLIGPYFLGKALATQAVNLTDMLEYGASIHMCRRILKLLPHIHDPLEQLDLKLKAYGTMGQAQTFWGLIKPGAKRNGLRALQRALTLATAYDKARGDLGHAGEKDEPRERNYIFMWYAYHDPTSRNAHTAYRQARVACEKDAISRNHLVRLRWLAAYRALLAGKSFPWQAFKDELPAPKPDWIRSLALKYRGALRAAAGDREPAIEDFKEAVKLIEKMESQPLLAFLGGTCDLEAQHSIRMSFLNSTQIAFCMKFAKQLGESYGPALLRRYLY